VTDHRIADIKVVMQEAGGAAPDNAVVGIVGGKLGHLGAKRAAYLYAVKME
jgi:hypothetical protein